MESKLSCSACLMRILAAFFMASGTLPLAAQVQDEAGGLEEPARIWFRHNEAGQPVWKMQKIDVLIDGEYFGTLTEDVDFLLGDIPEGEYTIEMFSSVHPNESQRVFRSTETLEAGASYVVTIRSMERQEMWQMFRLNKKMSPTQKLQSPSIYDIATVDEIDSTKVSVVQIFEHFEDVWSEGRKSTEIFLTYNINFPPRGPEESFYYPLQMSYTRPFQAGGWFVGAMGQVELTIPIDPMSFRSAWSLGPVLGYQMDLTDGLILQTFLTGSANVVPTSIRETSIMENGFQAKAGARLLMHDAQSRQGLNAVVFVGSDASINFGVGLSFGHLRRTARHKYY